MPQVELRIAARPALVRTARQVATTLARRVGLAGDVLDEVRLAVGEACSLAVALVGEGSDAAVSVRFRDDDGLAVEIRAPGDLPAAEGEAAAEVVAAAVEGVGTDDGSDPLPAGSTLMVLTSLVPDVTVRTGADGLDVRLGWPA